MRSAAEKATASSSDERRAELAKIQRTTSEILKRLDESHDARSTRPRCVADLFTPGLCFLRVRLRDYAAKLWLHDPLAYAGKAVDLYWRKVAYEPYALARQLKREAADRTATTPAAWTPVERAYLRSHLVNTLGHLFHWLAAVEEFDVAAAAGRKNSVSAPMVTVPVDFGGPTRRYGHNFLSEPAKSTWSSSYPPNPSAVAIWRQQVTHRLLMCLGDLTRYLQEFGQAGDVVDNVGGGRGSSTSAIKPQWQMLPQRYYRQALALDPHNGLPFNQLATLAGNDHYGLDAAFFYLRSLASRLPFDGAENNLKKLLERNSEHFERLNRSSSCNGQNDILKVLSSPKAETQRCVVFLLELVRVLVLDDINGSKLSQHCQRALQTVQHCLYLPMESMDGDDDYDDGDIDAESTSILPEDIASKMVLILLMLMQRLEGKESKLSMLRAYLLALYTHFVSKLLGDLHLKLFGPEALIELFETEEERAERERAKEEEKIRKEEEERKRTAEMNGKKAKARTKNRLDKFKRTLTRKSAEASMIDVTDDSDLSEGDRGNSDSDDDGGDFSDSSDNGASFDCASSDEDGSGSGLHSDSDTDDYDSDSDVIIESSRDIRSTLNLVRLVRSHHLNQALRICNVWLMRSQSVVRQASETGANDVLWTRLARLFATMSLENEDEYELNGEIGSIAKKLTGGMVQGVAMPEDFVLRGTALMEPDREAGIKWEANHHLDENEWGVLRILKFLHFRDWLCSFPESRIKLGEKGQVEVVAFVPRMKTASDEVGKNGMIRLSEKLKSATENGDEKEGRAKSKTKEVDEEDEAERNAEKEKMMQNMAQLWLQQEVKDLEGKGSRRRGGFSGFAHYSPYIVVDHMALTSHLHMVKEIVASRKFAVIIPNAVIQELDAMKKTHGKARTAIRWLEKQFQDGNRWLRPQRKTEATPLELMQYPKRKDKEAWQYFQILECCNYFSCVRRQGDGHEDGQQSQQERKIQVTLLTAAQANGDVDADGESVEAGNGEEKESRTYSPAGLAAAINIRVGNIDDFIKHNISSPAIGDMASVSSTGRQHKHKHKNKDTYKKGSNGNKASRPNNDQSNG